jgi:hypothetical protein
MKITDFLNLNFQGMLYKYTGRKQKLN